MPHTLTPAEDSARMHVGIEMLCMQTRQPKNNTSLTDQCIVLGPNAERRRASDAK